MKFNCAKLSPELPCVSARGRTIEIENSEERGIQVEKEETSTS